MRTLFQLMTFFVIVSHQVTSAQNDCGNTSFSGPKGVISSPNFPLPYPHNLSCTYYIDVSVNNSVLLKFLNFDLEAPSYLQVCRKDWLTITCNETNDENRDFTMRYCGTDLPRTSLRFSHCPTVTLTFFADSFVNGGGFAIEYTMIEGMHFEDFADADCGETMFTNSPGVIRLPTNPTDDPMTVNCTYTISTNHTSRIELNILPFQRSQLLDSFADCVRDYIKVGCVSDEEAELNRNATITFCRRFLPIFMRHTLPGIFSNCRVLKISMRSSDYNYRGNSSIPFTFNAMDKECGTSSFTGPNGTVKSPKFPLQYPHGLNCFYSIEVNRTDTMVLDFIAFHLEGTSARNACAYDWLTIRCSSDGSVMADPSQNRRYCGVRTNPMSLNYSNCDSLTLNFVSDSTINRGGFQIQYTITSAGESTPDTTDVPEEGCGNVSFTGPVGLISSPRFPLSYPNNLSCVYSIDVNRTKMVALRFLSFNMEGVSNSPYLDSCSYDWLLISCLTNSSVSAYTPYRHRKLCGAKPVPYILGLSNCDSLTLNFVTDSSLTFGGFQLRYTITSADKPDCGETFFSGPNGIVTSPIYPFPYPHNMSCKYFIDVGRSSSLLLKFKVFALENPDSEGTCKDWLLIRCNETTTANPFNYRKYCGSIQWTSPLRFIDCPSLVLEFVSDSSINGGGFVINYSVIDNSNFTDNKFELDCGTTIFSNTSGVISLPKNTKNYLATVNCTYTVSANRLSYIWFNSYFTSSAQILNSFEHCDTDSLTIGCVSEGGIDLNENTTMVLCRQKAASFYYSSRSSVFPDCRKLKLSIRSKHYDFPETLRIPFTVLGSDEICGNTSFSAPYGVVSSRNLRWHLSTRVNCFYTIDTSHENSVVLVVHRLSFGYINLRDGSCTNGWLTITCLDNGTSVANPHADRKLCNSSFLPTLRFSSCSSVLLNYSNSHFSYDTGFFVRYRMGDYDPECGNTSFSGPKGFIASPQFPLLYAHNLNCLYSITGGQTNTIFLSFLSFSLEGTSNELSIDSCLHDWVTVSCLSDQYDTTNISSSRRYCGLKRTPLKLSFPSCPVVVLNFRSDSSVTGGGFNIRYMVIDTESICGASAYRGPSGVISFPINFTDFDHTIDCSYFINATERSSISLTIWSISLQSFIGRNCQRDWLLITCTNGQTALDHRVSQSNCDPHNSSTQLTFPSCSAVKVVYHRDSEAIGKTFRIEYTITGYTVIIPTTVLPTTSSSTTSSSTLPNPTTSSPTTSIPTTSRSKTVPVTTKTRCATGCQLSSDATYCECFPVSTTYIPAISTSTQVVVTTHSSKCEVGCTKSENGTTCDCSTTHSDKFCDNETDTKYSIHWNRTIAGTNSSEPCPWNPTGWCSRECLPNTIWSQPTCNSCADKKFNDFFVRVNTLNLTALDNQNVTAKIASDLSTATNNSEGLTPGNLKASVELIKLLSDAIQRNDSNATINEMEIKSIVKAASNVLRPNNSESWETLKKENQNIATSILLSLDNYGRSLAALNISENRKEEENLILEAWSFEKSNLREIEFPSRSLWDEDRGDGISISVEALQSSMLSVRPTLKMWGSYYRTVNEYLPGHKDTDVVNSRVLSFSIDGLKTNEELKRPVIITLRHNQENRTGFQRKCAFWNFGSGTWDFDGCSVTLTNRTHTICSCNHLTNFAILMSLTPKEEDKLLNLISVIGCSISAAALILTILIYALTWKQSKSAQATVLLNLCVALASAYLIFLAGADKFEEEKYQKDGCTAVAVLLHYFFLAAFFIMLIEGVELVLYIIFVFHVRRTRETIMLIVSAWVLPLIIVGVSLGSTLSEGYGHKNACWLSAEKGLIWAFIGPVLFIVTANFVILIVVLSWMSQKKALLAKNGKKRDEIRATIWNLSVTCPVLGLGWLFGVLSLISDHVGFQYLFVIVNSLQGLLIFIFHALFHNKKMNEKISSFYSNYICRCRKSKLSVSTQITSAQEQSTSTTAASKATIEMTSAQEQSTSTTAASKATTEMTSAQEQSTSSILALTSTTEISPAQEQSTSSTPALTTTTEMTLAQDQATSSTSVTKVSTEMSSAQEQSTSSTRASASTAEVTSSQEQSTSSTSTSKVTTEMSSDQEQSTSSTSAKDSSAANKKPTDKAKVVPRAVKYYEDLIGRAGQFAQRCSAAYDQWRL